MHSFVQKPTEAHDGKIVYSTDTVRVLIRTQVLSYLALFLRDITEEQLLALSKACDMMKYGLNPSGMERLKVVRIYNTFQQTHMEVHVVNVTISIKMIHELQSNSPRSDEGVSTASCTTSQKFSS